MARFTLNRRTFLRGAGGAAVALPPLEIMSSRRARAETCTIPDRSVMLYAGVSIGGVAGIQEPIEENLTIPRTPSGLSLGPSYVVSRGLKSIGGGTVGSGATEDTYTSVKSHMGVISGLQIPLASGSASPPAGRNEGAGFHGTTTVPQTCGERETGTDQNTVTDAPLKGSSADQIIADAIKGTTPLPSLYLRAQASRYYGGEGGADSHISYRNARANLPIIRLRDAYNTLFTVGGAVNGKKVDVASFIDRRKSILDAVLDKSSSLSRRLGASDLRRLDQYYAEVRALEKTLESLKAKSGTLECKPGVEPVDPPVGNGIQPGFNLANPDAEAQIRDSWGNEELRAQVMADFLHLALACDLTRSAVFHLTIRQSQLCASYIIPNKAQNCDIHGVGHGGFPKQSSTGDMADVVDWHVKHMARLVAKLRDTTECDGSRVIDHTALFMLFEGGHGATGDPTRINDAHSTENMIVVVAGGAGGLKLNQHLHFASKRHPAEVVLTIMNAVGVKPGVPFGDITEANGFGPIPELFRLS